jgi:hypothetical protein
MRPIRTWIGRIARTRTATVCPDAAQSKSCSGQHAQGQYKIMATPFTHLLIAVGSLVTVYFVVAAWADDRSAGAHAPAELLQWHSGLTVSSDSYVKPEWKSTLTAIDPEDSTALLVMHGAAGLRDVAEDGFDYSYDVFDAPKRARKPARDPAGTQGGSEQTVR